MTGISKSEAAYPCEDGESGVGKEEGIVFDGGVSHQQIQQYRLHRYCSPPKDVGQQIHKLWAEYSSCPQVQRYLLGRQAQKGNPKFDYQSFSVISLRDWPRNAASAILQSYRPWNAT